ncbi:terminase large subunit [Kribbella solani]|uniref:hypothetical protein n=1 Tax=Kribbella solani TaxID=236067 RepID=UPI0029A72B23|nr:hypothetical protein [Kribbella solani]MDX3006730.1 terminase large subunit [Kribbella solani]
MSAQTLSTSSGQDVVLGSTTPRLWTPPLRELTPETSYGFDVIDFARDVLGTPLDPWEEWAVIHGGELLEDGRPRFRTLLILVARQNGKTLLAKVLILYWLFIEQVPLVGGTSTDRSYAKRTWNDVCSLTGDNRWLKTRLGPKWLRLTIGEEAMTTGDGAEYTFAANNRRAFRSTTLHRWICDELREHDSYDCWDSATNAMNAVPNAQTVCITNQGDDSAVVLDDLRKSALEYIETGIGDPRLGILEWSMPDGADVTDLSSLAMANPNLGRRIDRDALLGAAMRAKAAGGAQLAGFRTEVGCQRVHLLDPAIDPDRWDACGTDEPINLAEHRDRVALAFDVSLDGSHATLAAAALIKGQVHVEIVAQWTEFGCTQQLRREMPDLVRQVKPRIVGWMPSGPAAVVAADLATRRGAGQWWPPRGVKLEEITSEVTAVAMGLNDLVIGGEIVHPKDPMLDQHVRSASKLWRGDRWTFTRKGTGPVDATYAVAGAVHLARLLPPPLSPVTVA